MNNSKLYTFYEIFNLDENNDKKLDIEQIVIPIIQRDYAQGRQNAKVKTIRNNFLNSLKEGVLNNGISLDYVYGSIKDKKLTLLDGQQRLTTLFLLHWYAAKKNNIDPSEYAFLTHFSYEIRPSSRDFCNEIIDFCPDFTIALPISKQIENQYWFPYDWENDPTIYSMLVMIDAIHEKFNDVDNLWEELTINNKISFYFQSIENMGLSDELYIKMNSRGRPLTNFEHFKAEFIRNLHKHYKGNNVEKEISHKIDLLWTDFLWKYVGKDYLVDPLFLNYFKYICDIICYKNDGTTQNRGYDEFHLIDLYFSADNADFEKNINTLETLFDIWANCDMDCDELFNKFISIKDESVPNKIKGFGFSDANILRDCLNNYYDEKEDSRSSTFSYRKFILLYSFIQYLINKDNITEEQFHERLRIINNITLNSEDNMSDSTSRSQGNTLPAMLRQTEDIIINGILDDENTKFSAKQVHEEILKCDLRTKYPEYINDLNMLENLDVLQGQVEVLDLNAPNSFNKFYKLFTECDKDKISCALMTYCDYSRLQRWRKWVGVSKPNEKSTQNTIWRTIFRRSAMGNMENTQKAVRSLLNDLDVANNENLDNIISKYINYCEEQHTYSWRYYYIKYPELFRPNCYGKYCFGGEGDKDEYNLCILRTQSYFSSSTYNPFLKFIDDDYLQNTKSPRYILYEDGSKLECHREGYVFYDGENKVAHTLEIAKNEDGSDSVDRILFYSKNTIIRDNKQ